MKIIGVGFDSPEDTQAWAQAEGYTYEIWTDDNKTLALYYGAIAEASAARPARVSFLLDAEGQLLLEYVQDVDWGTHPVEVLEDCQQLLR